ncbi:hypothetical protein WKW79_33810 [Variovorax robiniae]|uniref:Uncharacterized protein n=1 Tax=Variovorax robiniae TaxID=1836199 RepID=A0ABU8XKN4_9BURK
MQVRVIQRIAAVLKGVEEPSATSCWLIALAVSIALGSGAAASQPLSTKVSTAEQSSRENDRLLILRNELRKSEALVESLARRRAERFAASDVAAADEAENDRIRVLSDVAGLKREIAGTQPAAAATPATAPTGDARAAAVRPARTRAERVAPWWDVYGKSRRADSAGSKDSAQASGAAPTRLEPHRRME